MGRTNFRGNRDINCCNLAANAINLSAKVKAAEIREQSTRKIHGYDKKIWKKKYRDDYDRHLFDVDRFALAGTFGYGFGFNKFGYDPCCKFKTFRGSCRFGCGCC